MNSEYIRTFVTLAQLGSYTKTAQKMIVVPSTISKQIKLLEAELGRELVIRDKKAVKLTRAGEIFLQYAQRILDAESACMAEIDAVVDSNVNLRIGTVFSLFQSHVTEWLSSYLRENPNLRCSVVVDHSQSVLNYLYDGELDLCFSFRSFRENNCECIPFLCDEMALVTGPDQNAYSDGITVEELKKLPLIKESQLKVADPALYNQLFAHNDNVVLSLTKGNLIVPFMKSSIGYGFAVRGFIKEELAAGQLLEIPLLDRETPKLQSYLVYKKANPLVKPSLVEHITSFAAGKKQHTL